MADRFFSEESPRFIADPCLGKTARWLRALGYDTLYMRSLDEAFLRRQLAMGRVLLTKSQTLARQKSHYRPYLVKTSDSKEQLRDIVAHFRLRPSEKFLSRCLECNVELVEASRDEVAGGVPDFVFGHHEEFYRCPACKKIFWAGSHRRRMEERFSALLGVNLAQTEDEGSD